MRAVCSKLLFFLSSLSTPARLYLAIFIVFFLVGCKSLQVNIPVEVQAVEREEAALLVYIENKSTLYIKVTYPVQSDFLRPSQSITFPLPRPGNYRIVVSAYEESKDLRYDYRMVGTIEIPVFLNGHDIVRSKGGFVGRNIEVTDGMLFPGNPQ